MKHINSDDPIFQFCSLSNKSMGDKRSKHEISSTALVPKLQRTRYFKILERWIEVLHLVFISCVECFGWSGKQSTASLVCKQHTSDNGCSVLRPCVTG